MSDGKRVLVDNSDTHSIIFGATGSKKTRLFGMPLINMLTLAGESFIATDPKSELYDKTSGLVSAEGYRTFVLNLRELEQSDYWNPLAHPYELYHAGQREEATALLGDFINTLAEPQKKSTREPFWINMASHFALAMLLFLIETAAPSEANIYNFTRLLVTRASSDTARELALRTAPGSIASLNFVSVLTAAKADATFSSIAGVAASLVAPFLARRTLCQILSESSFDLRTIAKQKTAIYLIVPDEKSTLHFLVSIFIKQLYETLITEAQEEGDKKLPIRLNFVLDEFCNIPTIPDFAEMITAARSRNMRFFLMNQGMRQMHEKYGVDAETIKGNCDNWAFLTSREPELLRELSYLCGEKSYYSADGVMRVRPLISPSELMRLDKGKGEVLILHGRHYPFVTELTDIDAYPFPSYPPIVRKSKMLPTIIPYDAWRVIAEIDAKVRPLAFSLEVYGEDKYFDASVLPEKKIPSPNTPAGE